MKVSLSKSQLRELQEHRGQVDKKTGQVFSRLVAALDLSDGLYHGSIEMLAPDPDRTDYQTFDLLSILTPLERPPTGAATASATRRRVAPITDKGED